MMLGDDGDGGGDWRMVCDGEWRMMVMTSDSREKVVTPTFAELSYPCNSKNLSSMYIFLHPLYRS